MPTEVARVDVGGEALLEAVQLVRADEVHLPRQAGQVASIGQVMGEGRDLRRPLGSVVPRSNGGREQTRHHHTARRPTQGRVGVRRIEYDPLVRQASQVRRLHDRVAVAGQEVGCQLVGHDQHDVGALHLGCIAALRPARSINLDLRSSE